MMSPAIKLTILFLASELHAVGGQVTSQNDARNGRGKRPRLEDVKAAQCPTTAPFKCVEANGYCYNFTQYCDRSHNKVESCFVEVTDVVEFCRSAKSPINPQCRYACLDQLGLNTTDIRLSAAQGASLDFSQSKCPLYTCRNSTGTECYEYDAFCNSDGIVKSCFPEGTCSRDDRLKWCNSGEALLNDQCKYACTYEKNETDINTKETTDCSDEQTDVIPHIYIGVAIIVAFIIIITVAVLCWRKYRSKPATPAEAHKQRDPAAVPLTHVEEVARAEDQQKENDMENEDKSIHPTIREDPAPRDNNRSLQSNIADHGPDANMDIFMH